VAVASKNRLVAGGDRNTKFFHACANARKKSNFISSISNTEGHTFTSTEEVQSAFVSYFQNLFTSDNVGDMSPCLQSLKKSVTENMNQDLLKTFSVEEVYGALHDMAPLKAPGPRRFHSRIFSEELECRRGGYLSHHLEYSKFRCAAAFFKSDKYCSNSEDQKSG
jgi:hypothetical protein